MRILHLQYFFKYVLTYFLHLNSYLVTFLYNTICRAQPCCSVSFGISFEHAVQLPFTVLLYSAFLSLSPSQIKNTQAADTVPVHGHSPLVVSTCVSCYDTCYDNIGNINLLKSLTVIEFCFSWSQTAHTM